MNNVKCSDCMHFRVRQFNEETVKESGFHDEHKVMKALDRDGHADIAWCRIGNARASSYLYNKPNRRAADTILTKGCTAPDPFEKTYVRSRI